MNFLKMKTQRFVFAISILLFIVAGTGCKEPPSDYYKGKIIVLNNHVAYTDIIEIQQSVDNGLAIGQTISVGVLLTDKGYKLNDVVYFKIVHYQKWEGPDTTDHLWPGYTGTIELYNK